jgi:diguanylate cyclase (GGDEF)-like protein
MSEEPDQSSEAVAHTLDTFFEGFQHVIPFDRIGFATVDQENVVRLIWVKSKLASTKLGVGYHQALSTSSLEQVAAVGEPRVIEDLGLYLDEYPSSLATKRLVSEGIRSSLTCPIQNGGTTLGFLFFSSCMVGAYDGQDQDVYVAMAALFRQMLKQNDHLREQLETNHVLREESVRDPVTRLLNRRGFEQVLRSMAVRNRRKALVFFDLDGFKYINDAHGHEQGDEVLSHVAAAIQSSTRDTDYASRYGGDEFAVLLSDCANAEQVTQRILEAIRALPYGITASAGVVCYDADIHQPKQLLDAADRAMYSAKSAGGDQFALLTLINSEVAPGPAAD